MATSIDIPIRPGAALNDPETRRHVDDQIVNRKPGFSERHSYIKHGFDTDGVLNILANYPWQEFTYKSGRWQKQPFAEEVSFLPFLRSWEISYGPVQLIDPSTGADVAQINGTSVGAAGPDGRLLFAGDPHYAGVVSIHNLKGHWISIVGSVMLGYPEDRTAIGTKAAELARTMTPERTPDIVLPANFPKSYLKTLGPWIADHPEKPPRKGVAGTFKS